MIEEQPSPQQPGQIAIEPMNNRLRDQYRFVATRSDGTTLLKGDQFRSNMFRFAEGKSEKAVLHHFITELAVLGWQAVPTGGKWYEHRLYHIGAGKVGVVQAASPERRGLSPGVMWGWSIVLIIGLFLLCVVLVFSTEFRMTPGLFIT